MIFTEPYKLFFVRGLGILSILVLWQVGAEIVASPLILPGPGVALAAFVGIITQPDFWLSLAASLGRTVLAFGLTLGISLPLGVLMGLFPLARAFFSPYIATLRSTPVISVIVLGLIWFKPEDSPVWVCLLMTIPLLVQAVAEGVQARDRHLEEMARAFDLAPVKIFMKILIPGLFPYFRAGGRSALGIGWKVVAAAEVLSMPNHGLGTMLQDARTYLETGQVLALTATLVLVAGIGDLLIAMLLRLPHEQKRKAKLTIGMGRES